jgi:hypothetical protein
MMIDKDENYLPFFQTLLECEFDMLNNNIINRNANVSTTTLEMDTNETDENYLRFLHTLLESDFNVLDNNIITGNASGSNMLEMDIDDMTHENVNKEDEDGDIGDQVGYTSTESDDDVMDDDNSQECIDCMEVDNEFDDEEHIEKYIESYHHITTNKSTEACALRGGNIRYSSDEEDDTVELGEYEIDEAALLDIDDMDDEEDIEVIVEEEIIQNEGSSINQINRNVLAQQLAQTNRIGARYNMDASLPQPVVTRHSLGEMNVTCSFCNALGFRCENKGTISSPHFGRLCCNKGKSKFESYPYLPDELMELYEGNSIKAKYFRKHIRYFNSGMAMASLTAGHDATVRGNGPPGAYRINGIMYRRIGAITSYEGCNNPKFVQTYFYSSEQQSAHRSTRARRQEQARQQGSTSRNEEATVGHNESGSQENTNSESMMEVEIFELLRKVLVEDCHTYMQEN